jgi:hypothetical protein
MANLIHTEFAKPRDNAKVNLNVQRRRHDVDCADISTPGFSRTTIFIVSRNSRGLKHIKAIKFSNEKENAFTNKRVIKKPEEKLVH